MSTWLVNTRTIRSLRSLQTMTRCNGKNGSKLVNLDVTRCLHSIWITLDREERRFRLSVQSLIITSNVDEE